MGVSGCGKTRILYELLARKWGFYWTASTTRNGGSIDVSMVGRQAGGEDPGSVKHYAAVGFMTKLVLARLLILQYARRLMPDLTPEQWLLLQTEFWRYLPEGAVDPFQELGLMLENLYDLGKEWELYTLWTQVVRELKCRPVFVMDEAQHLQSPNGFLSPSSLQLRSRFSPVVQALVSKLFDTTVCIAGTGISILQLEDCTRSLVGKLGTGYPLFVTGFGRWDSVEGVHEFCERYISGLRLSKENCARLFDKFRGRKRCLVTCLEMLMLKGEWSMPVVDEFYAKLTTKSNADYAMSLHAVVAEFFLSGKGTFRCRGKDLSASELVKHIVNHHMFSKRVAFALESSEAELVEWGIGSCELLAMRGELSTYVIDEHMVMDSMVNYCREHGHITGHLKTLMDSCKDEPSTCGLIWEQVVVCHAPSIFDGSKTLNSWVKSVTWDGIFAGNLMPKLLGVRGPVWRETTDARLSDYLALPVDKRQQFFMFSRLSGPDIMAFVSLGEFYIPVFFQMKLRYVVDWEEAECTTNPLKMYRRSNDTDHPQMIEECKYGCISLVVAYPAAARRPPRCILQSGALGPSYRLVVYLGKEELKELFSEELCDFLDYIKPETMDYKAYKEYLKKSGIRTKRARRESFEKPYIL